MIFDIISDNRSLSNLRSRIRERNSSETSNDSWEKEEDAVASDHVR